jgi:Taurine catabolism dioxygenase TauD, TfdA family
VLSPSDASTAAVYGVDIAAGVSEADFADIVRLFNGYSVLVFHQQDITDEQQIAFSRRFSSRTKGVRRLAVVLGVTPDYLYQLTHLLLASSLVNAP